MEATHHEILIRDAPKLGRQRCSPQRQGLESAGNDTFNTETCGAECAHHFAESDPVGVKSRTGQPFCLPPATREAQIVQTAAEVILQINLVRDAAVSDEYAAQFAHACRELVVAAMLQHRVRPGKVN